MNGKFRNLTSGENLTLLKVLHFINLFVVKTDSLLNGRKCNTERLKLSDNLLENGIFGKIKHCLIYFI